MAGISADPPARPDPPTAPNRPAEPAPLAKAAETVVHSLLDGLDLARMGEVVQELAGEWRGEGPSMGLGELISSLASNFGGLFQASAPSGSAVTALGPAPAVSPKTSPGAGPNPYAREFQEATAIAGVPADWAERDSLNQLVQHESGFRPDAKNPGSTAFGMFQMIDSTWDKYLPEAPYGSTDPKLQAVGGYRYIQAAYGDPDRAWAFWQATAQGNADLAPPDLRAKARNWISHGYKGY